MVQAFRGMYDKVERLEGLLAQDKAKPLGPAPNLLLLHYHITQLETFRNETMHQAKRATPEARATLEKYFERPNALLKEFEEYYLGLAGDLIQIVRKGNPGVAVKIAKIAELEGQKDEKAIAIRLVKKQNTEMASRFKSMQADARQLKHYRAKVLDAIRNTAKQRLQEQHEKMQGNSAQFFSSLDWFYEDLVVVEDQLSMRFPPDWKIFTQYIKAYHKALSDFIVTIVDGQPEAGTMLYLAQFCKEYYKNMTKELQIAPELIEPKLLDGREDELIDDYLLIVRKKMAEWTTNLMKTETRDFTNRETEPDTDADGQYLMQGAPIMFQSASMKAAVCTADVTASCSDQSANRSSTGFKPRLSRNESRQRVQRDNARDAGNMAESDRHRVRPSNCTARYCSTWAGRIPDCTCQRSSQVC